MVGHDRVLGYFGLSFATRGQHVDQIPIIDVEVRDNFRVFLSKPKVAVTRWSSLLKRNRNRTDGEEEVEQGQEKE